MYIEVKVQVNYWRKNAVAKWKTARGLTEIRRYADCLFFCHLTLESLLKGLYVARTGTYAPKVHNLLYLAQKAHIQLDARKETELKSISTFNIAGRYPDEKLAFYRRINKDQAEQWLATTNRLRLWLLKEYKNVRQ